MNPISIVKLTCIACLSLGIASAAAEERTMGHCIPLSEGHAGAGAMTPDAGGFSQTTQEHLDGPMAFLVARVERGDGRVHPAFGTEAHDLLIHVTTSGQYVVRILEPRDGTAWR